MNLSLSRMLAVFPPWRRRGASAAGSGRIEDIAWPEFEQLVRAGLLKRGYHPTGTGRTATGGDLLMRRDSETCLIYCKAWRDRKVDLDTLEAMHRAMSARNVPGGMVLTFGRVGREATRFAASHRIQLLDGPALKALIEPVRAKTKSN